MADHSKPTLTSTYSNFLSEVDGRIDDLAVGLDPAVTTATNVPTGSIRWNSASSKWEKWSGTAWADLSASYNINLAGPLTLTANSSSDALRITQTGAGNALVVEDSANPDSSPFVVDGDGNVGIAVVPSGTSKLQVYTGGTSVSQQYIQIDGGGGSGSTQGQCGISFRPLNSGTYGAATIEAYEEDIADFRGYLTFSTRGVESDTAPTERMRIRSDGNIGIGGTGNGAVSFYNQKTITGGTTSYGNYTNSTVQSDVTTYGIGNRTALSTAAASFSTSLFCYWASQGTIGAGSSVTNQYGFYTDAQLTGATNNYGFYSNIASGTGRWNFYAAGTADNYFVGNLLRGISTTAVATVAGSTSHTPGFQIHGNSLSSASSAQFAWNTGNYFTFNRSASGSAGTQLAVSDNDTLGALQFNGSDGTAFVGSAQIRGAVNGTVGSSDVPGMLQFYTKQQGAGLLERLRIDSAGRCDMQSNLSQTASGTASSISGTTLTVGGTVAGTFAVGDRIWGANVEPNTFITALGTGTGGAGTYIVSNTQTVASTTIYALSGGVNVFRFTDTDNSVNAGQPIGTLEWYGSDISTPGAGVKAYIAGISESATPDSALIFGTSDNVASTQAVERWRIDSTGKLTAATGSGLSISKTAVTAPAASDGNVFSGTYTPTQVSTNTNVTSVTFNESQYMRVGNVVTVSGRLGITATATGNTVVRMSFPIASSTSTTAQCGGIAVYASSTIANNTFGYITTDSTNDCVQFQGNSTISGTNVNFWFTFTYQVI